MFLFLLIRNRKTLTPQQREGAVLQLHDDSVQHRQHRGDVQQDQGDWLMTGRKTDFKRIFQTTKSRTNSKGVKRVILMLV